jgi:membrane-bound serine protease (ClpP class)
MAVLIAAAFVISARLVLKARRRPVTTGGAEMVGETGTSREDVTTDGGLVSVNGEIWSARAPNGVTIPAGAPVRVVRVHPDDLTLTVEPREG